MRIYVPKQFQHGRERYTIDVVKGEDFDELKKEAYEDMGDTVSKRGYGRNCYAFWCSCRLSL
jgi:phage terminase large subunit-like protein